MDPVVVITMMGTAIGALFGVIARYIIRLEKKVEVYEEAMRKSLEAYQERDRQEAEWWRERQERKAQEAKAAQEGKSGYRRHPRIVGDRQ